MDNCKPWIGCSCQRMSAANKYIEERPKLEPKSGAMEKSRKSIALIEYFVIPAWPKLARILHRDRDYRELDQI